MRKYPAHVPLRVCVAGVTGWTGSAVPEAIETADDLELVAGVSRSDPTRFSTVEEALNAVPADVLVDYTHADAVRGHVLSALDRRVAVVVGSSGLSADEYEEIDARAREQVIGVIAAGNFSLTAALLLRFAEEAARHVASWEVIDYSSLSKPDAPSGTSREARRAPGRRQATYGGCARGRDSGGVGGAWRNCRLDASAFPSVGELHRVDGDRLRP
jgi:4-hydroxy-tetrahydrodipicolinate reductase